MQKKSADKLFDVIIVGSGSGGASLARELSTTGKNILILERGGNEPLKESLIGMATIAKEIPVTKKLKDMGAVTAGGTTALYFATAEPPPLNAFLAQGIDLSAELKQTRQELPIGELPDELLGAQAHRLKDSAVEMGLAWKKDEMFIDQSKCNDGYSYEAKWKARSYVIEAVSNGVEIVHRAEVLRVIIEGNKAIGVEYKIPKKIMGMEICRVYAERTVLSAGVLATPTILRRSGLKNIVKNGFAIDPNVVLFGLVPGLVGKNSFIGSMGAHYDENIYLGDAHLNKFLYRMMMLFCFKPLRLASYKKTIAMGVKVKDALSGELNDKGHYYKVLTPTDYAHIEKGKNIAVKVLQNAGAEKIFCSGVNSTGVGGVLKIQDQVDEKLETEVKNLHVCDRSVMPSDFRGPPVLSLVCLGKYLSKQLIKIL